MQLFDTHCHIHDHDYPLDVEQVLMNAAAQNVSRLMCVGTDVTTSKEAVEFVQDRPNCWASIGLHPHDAKLGESTFLDLKELLPADPRKNKIVAIGECGLDYFYENSPKKEQEQALRFQIELALQHDLPIIFHVRDAFDDFWPIFDSYQSIRGVIHSYTDNMANLEKILERDLYVGVNGITTFTKNEWQLEVAKAIPLQKMLLETDAPFLTPKPKRGTMNEPANVWLVAKFLSELRGLPEEEIASQTTQNANTLFNL